MSNEKLKEKKFDYKWVIVVLSFLMVCLSLGFASSTKGLFLKPVTEYLGVSRSVYSINDSCRYVATALINLAFGSMVAKYGPKKLIVAGVFSLIVAMLIYSFASSVYLFFVAGAFLGIGFSWTSTTMVGYVVNVWCRENKGTIMGAILASNGIGGAIAMQIVSPIISSSATGYKNAYLLIAATLTVLLVLLVIFFKDKPKNSEGELSKELGKGKKKRGQEWVGIEFKELVKKWWFYLALVCVFFTGFVLQGITGISAAHMGDVGLASAFVATVMSAHSIALACFKFLTGFIYDKFGLRITMSVCSIAAIVVMILLSLVTNSTTGMVFAMCYGVLSSLALPLETIMLPIYASDLFGQKSYGKVLGIVVAVNVAGYALGSPIVNLVYSLTSSYMIALYGAAIVMAFVIIGMNVVISKAKKERIMIEKESSI